MDSKNTEKRKLQGIRIATCIFRGKDPSIARRFVEQRGRPIDRMRINRITSSQCIFIVAPMYTPHAAASLQAADRIAFAMHHARTRWIAAGGKSSPRADRRNERETSGSMRSDTQQGKRSPRDLPRASPSCRVVRQVRFLSGNAGLFRRCEPSPIGTGSLYSAGSGTRSRSRTARRCVSPQARRLDD